MKPSTLVWRSVPCFCLALVALAATPSFADGFGASSCFFPDGQSRFPFGIAVNVSASAQPVFCNADPTNEIGSFNATFRVVGAQVSRLIVADNNATADIVC